MRNEKLFELHHVLQLHYSCPADFLKPATVTAQLLRLGKLHEKSFSALSWYSKAYED